VGDKGVVVIDVDPSGAAATKGIEVGDVILEVGGQTVSNPADVKADLATARKDGKKVVLLRIKSQEGTRFVAIGLGSVG
jgi:serine protease Do